MKQAEYSWQKTRRRRKKKQQRTEPDATTTAVQASINGAQPDAYAANKRAADVDNVSFGDVDARQDVAVKDNEVREVETWTDDDVNDVEVLANSIACYDPGNGEDEDVDTTDGAVFIAAGLEASLDEEELSQEGKRLLISLICQCVLNYPPKEEWTEPDDIINAIMEKTRVSHVAIN